jgi:hypothetical protein
MLEPTYNDSGCTNTPMDMLIEAWNLHYRFISAHERFDIASGDSDVYKASQSLILSLIPRAFPDNDVEEVYWLAIDCGSITDVADHLAREAERAAKEQVKTERTLELAATEVLRRDWTESDHNDFIAYVENDCRNGCWYTPREISELADVWIAQTTQPANN